MGRFANSTIMLSLIVVFFGGCATTGHEDEARTSQAEPVCYNKSDCEAKWSAAAEWVLNNTKVKIHIFSNDVIITDESPPDSPLLACFIRKQSTGQAGVYTIAADMWCNNLLGCTPSIKHARASFNKFVNSAGTNGTAKNVEPIKTKDSEKPQAGVKAGMIDSKVVVKDVVPGSPAQKAGLKVNDVILAFDNVRIKDTADLAGVSQGAQLGDKKKIRIQRGSEVLDLLIEYPTLKEIRSNTPQSEVPDTKAR